MATFIKVETANNNGRAMGDREYLRDIAHRCIELSSHCFHLEIAGKLRELADELTARASESQEPQKSDIARTPGSEPKE